jgi:hypothetical protein
MRQRPRGRGPGSGEVALRMLEGNLERSQSSAYLEIEIAGLPDQRELPGGFLDAAPRQGDLAVKQHRGDPPHRQRVELGGLRRQALGLGPATQRH